MSISKEAIEAGARALYEAEWGKHANWRLNKAGDKAYWCAQAAAALTAAAPHIQAAALRDAAEVFATGEWADAFMTGNVTDDVSAVKATDKWLTDRADQLEGKAK